MPAPAPLRPPAVDHRRAHAQRPPRACRVVAVAPDPLGQQGRTDGRAARHPDPREPPAPRAGLSPLSGDHAAGAASRKHPAPCARARALGSCRYHTVRNILAAGQGRLPIEPPAETKPTPTHANFRGADYYAAATTTEEDKC